MPDILTYNPASTPVANRTVRYYRSVTESEYDTRAAGLPYLVQPALPEGFLVGIGKVVGGVVQLLDQADLDAIAAAQAAEQAAAEDASQAAAKVSATQLMDRLNSPEGRALVALAKVVTDEINILRSQHSLAARTLSQLKTAVVNEINAQPDND